MNNGVQIFVIEGIPDIQPGDKLDQIIGKCLLFYFKRLTTTTTLGFIWVIKDKS